MRLLLHLFLLGVSLVASLCCFVASLRLLPSIASTAVFECCRVTEKGNYSEKDAADLIRQVLEGVAYLHAQGVPPICLALLPGATALIRQLVPFMCRCCWSCNLYQLSAASGICATVQVLCVTHVRQGVKQELCCNGRFVMLDHSMDVSQTLCVCWLHTSTLQLIASLSACSYNSMLVILRLLSPGHKFVNLLSMLQMGMHGAQNMTCDVT